jgi:hypothetical protein
VVHSRGTELGEISRALGACIQAAAGDGEEGDFPALDRPASASVESVLFCSFGYWYMGWDGGTYDLESGICYVRSNADYFAAAFVALYIDHVSSSFVMWGCREIDGQTSV